MRNGRVEQLKYKYDITLEEYDGMFEHQNGVCAICLRPETTKNNQGAIKRLSVDHNHETGKNRGLLCHKCNMGLGYFDDNVVILHNAATYLESFE